MAKITCWLPLVLGTFILTNPEVASEESGEQRVETASECKLSRWKEMLAELCHKYQKTEIHVSVTDITTQKLPEAECESKLQQSEAINNLKATIDDLTKTVKANNGTVRMTSNYFTKILKAINRKERWLNEDKKQFQATIDDLTRTVESLNQTIQMLCGKPNDACRYLLEAVKSGDGNTVKILFKCTKRNCTTDDEYRYTPLIYAAMFGNVDLVRVLLEAGANLDRANANGHTALHYAASNGQLDMCLLLLSRGAKVNAKNVKKHTPLHYAALSGHLAVVKLLVERGANVRLKDEEGRNASALARGNGYKNVAEWLDLEGVDKER